MIDIKVNFKIETDDLIGYEFKTKDDVFIEEMDDKFDLFRLEKHKDDGKIYILVASYDTFHVYDDATSDFSEYLLEIYDKCLEDDKNGLVPSANEEYLKFLKEEEENEY